MDSNRFDVLTRTLSSRRAAVGRLLGGGLLAALGVSRVTGEAEAAVRCPRGKKRCRKKCIRKRNCCTNANCRPGVTGKVCRRGRCVCRPGTKPCEGRCLHPDAACPPAPNAACTVVGNVQAGFPDELRAVQTFTEPNGGQLHAVELYFANQQPGSTGNYLVQINTVDQATGVPQHNTVASALKPSAEVSRNLDLVLVGFSTPPTLVAGRQYAILLSRPGGTGSFLVELVRPGPCPGGEHFTSFGAAGAFQRPSEPEDMYYRTFVSP